MLSSVINDVCVCRPLGSSSLDSTAADDAAAAAAVQRFHIQRLAAAAAAMRYSPYHFSPHPCLPLPGLVFFHDRYSLIRCADVQLDKKSSAVAQMAAE